MHPITEIVDYSDERGNSIRCLGAVGAPGKVSVSFKGSGNTLTLQPGAAFNHLKIDFEGDGGSVDIGRPHQNSKHSLRMRLGHYSHIVIGPNCSEEAEVYFAVAEGCTITVGSDVMFASRNQVRATDTHAIYDLAGGARVNPSADVVIGNHVWFAVEAVVLAGSSIGDNSVIGFRALVAGNIPANVVAVGIPAKAIRTNIEWKRPVTYGFKNGPRYLGISDQSDGPDLTLLAAPSLPDESPMSPSTG